MDLYDKINSESYNKYPFYYNYIYNYFNKNKRNKRLYSKLQNCIPV